MVGFRNQVGREPLTQWVSPSSQRISFSRGTHSILSSPMSPTLAGKTQVQSASSRSTTRTARGARHSRRAFLADPTATSSTAHHPTTTPVPGPRTFRFYFSCCNLLFKSSPVLLLTLMEAWSSPSARTRRSRCTRVL